VSEELVVQRRPVDDIIGRGVEPMEPNVGPEVRRVVDEGNGQTVMVLDSLPGPERAALRRAVLAYPRSTISRGRGIRNRGSSFGYLAANTVLRRASCRACNAAEKAPREHALICNLSATLTDRLAAVLPDRAATDAETTSVIPPEWRLAESPWTSGVVNYDAPLPYHRDANNLQCWSAMIGLRRAVTGGHFHIPEYDVVLPIRDGDLLFFAGWDLIHGVTPLVRRQPDGYRVTLVWYSVNRMVNCAPVDDALATGRAARTNAEDHWRERQTAAGLLES
jgi:hypothetical protein